MECLSISLWKYGLLQSRQASLMPIVTVGQDLQLRQELLYGNGLQATAPAPGSIVLANM